MPPVGVRVSLNIEMQKFLAEKTVTPSPGQNPRMTADSAQVSAASVAWTKAEPDRLMERVLAPANLKRAYQRVVSNKGAPGADGMTVDELAGHVKQYWPILKARLLAGEYQRPGVRAVDIPKPKGGTRQLGIPCVVDRLIQQALLQQLTPIFDPLFSDYSYGFRPGRSAHQAIETARVHVATGHRWCVELDLEKFFDRVNHDILMAHVQRHVEDKRVLKLIRRYLEAGVMSGGIVSRRQEGTPQGGPLSPLLSNILLDELDRELERRGHRFVRYADDANIYVRSQPCWRAGDEQRRALPESASETDAEPGKESSSRVLDVRLLRLWDELASAAEAAGSHDEPASFARPAQRAATRSAGLQDDKCHQAD